MVLTVRRRAPASHLTEPHPSMMPHSHLMASKCDSELSLPQERVKYVVVDNPEAVYIPALPFSILRPCARVTPKDHPRAPEKPLADIQRF